MQNTITALPAAGAPHGLWMFDVHVPGRQIAHIPKTGRSQGEALLRLINENLLPIGDEVQRIDCVAILPVPVPVPVPGRDAPQADAASAQAQPEGAA